jgi:DNA polymerase III delta subunit
MLHLILGPDRLLARESARALTAELDPTGANTTWLDGRETTPERVISAVGTISFFGAAPVVVVSDLLARGKQADETEGGETSGEPRKRDASPLGTIASAVPASHHLILLEPGLTSAPAILKSAASGANVIANEPPRGSALVAWIVDTAARSASTIDRRAAQRLAETLYPQTWDRKPSNPRYDRPPDMALLTLEIEKLALAAHPGPITVETLETLTPGGPDQRVFRFLDAALAGDLRTAFAELERLEAAGEEPAMLLAQLLGQLELANVVAAAGVKDASSVARDLGAIAPPRVSAVMNASRRLPPRRAPLATTGAGIDRSLKTGRVRRPIDALHGALLALASKA